MGEEDRGDLRSYSVSLPRALREKLPIARLITGKTIQQIVREALEEHLRELNVKVSVSTQDLERPFRESGSRPDPQETGGWVLGGKALREERR
jgi:predicted DNA-binding protein